MALPAVDDAVPLCVVASMGNCADGPERSFLKWPSSKVDIGWVGYAKGSPDGNMIGIRSGIFCAASSGWVEDGCCPGDAVNGEPEV